jgi:hypothetical protein
MAGLSYIGTSPTANQDVSSRLQANAVLLAPTPNQTSVITQVNTAVSGLASSVAVNNALNSYVQSSYLTSQAALLIPLSSKGAVNGVASLDGTGKIPLSQIPVLGAPWVKGPYGPTGVFTATSSASPVKIADWNIGVAQFVFQPLVYMSLFAQTSAAGRPVVEVWINNSPSPSYGTGTMVAKGSGRTGFSDFQAIAVHPSSTIPSAAGQGYATNYTTWLTAWVYDANGQSVTVNSNNIASAAAYLWRVRQ